jgi:hypothetical protein
MFATINARKAAALKVNYELVEELARRRFINFCQYVFKGFIVAKHHIQIANAIDQVVAGNIKRLHIALPPRHSKSLMCSELLPAFWFGHFPDSRIIHASYASSLSNGFSLSVRALINENPKYHRLFPKIALHPARRRIDDWRLTTGGGFRSIGVQGGITGSGADLFIIDDPHKEGDEKSPTTLEAVYTWFSSAAITRLSPGAPVLFPMTRWHPNDLAGRLINLHKTDPNADFWDTLIYAALATENDPLGRNPGEALWPNRYPVTALKAIRAISERYFEALYQQNPQFYDEPLFSLKDFQRGRTTADRYFWTFDLALTETSRSDYTVMGRWSLQDGILALHKLIRMRAQWPKVKQKIIEVMNKYPDDNLYFPTQLIELMAIQTLRHERRDSRRIKEVDMPGDKYARASVLSDFAKNSTVLIVPGEEGTEFVNQHLGFPDTAKHDDDVDMSSVATHAKGLQNRFYLKIAEVERESIHRQDATTIEELGY